MLTETQAKFIELANKYEDLKKQLKELQPQMDQLMTEIGVGSYFQDPSTNVVYKITVPDGTFIQYKTISFDRTKKPEESRGSLSKKEAEEQGFAV